MAGKGRPWTEEEIVYLRENYETCSCKEIGKQIGRSTPTVQQKSCQLGLKRKQPEVGDKLFRLTILDKYLKRHNNKNKTVAICKCECGKTCEVTLTFLKKGLIKSCGCLHKDVTYKNIDKNTIKEMYLVGKSQKEIGKLLGVSQDTICQRLKELKIKARDNRIYFCNENYFEKINTEEKAYWLGFIYADGCVQKNRLQITINTGDEHHLEKLQASLDSNYPVYQSVVCGSICNQPSTNKKYYQSRIAIVSTKLTNDLISHGVFRRKSLILKPPTTVPNDLLRHFYRGYVDGDGGITKDVHSWRIYAFGTREFLVEMLNFIKKHVDTKVNVRPRKTIYSLRFGGNKLVKNISKLFYHNATIYLNRKYELYLKITQEQNV